MAQNNEPADVDIQPGDPSSVKVADGSELAGLLASLDTVADDSDDVEVPAAEQPGAKPPAPPAEADRGLERLAAREKEVRDLEASYSKRDSDLKQRETDLERVKSTYISPDELKNNPNAVLQKLGLDEDQFMRRVLYNKLPDGHPVKEKLAKELSDYIRDKRYADLEAKLDAKERAAAENAEMQRTYQAQLNKMDQYVETFKGDANKTLPLLSTIGKKDSGVVRDLILEEMITDASKRLARGEVGAPITAEDAAGRIEKLLVRLQPYFSTAPAENVVPTVKPRTQVGKNKQILPAPPVPKQPPNELEAMLHRLGVQ
jgi:hypothetical protein